MTLWMEWSWSDRTGVFAIREQAAGLFWGLLHRPGRSQRSQRPRIASKCDAVVDCLANFLLRSQIKDSGRNVLVPQ